MTGESNNRRTVDPVLYSERCGSWRRSKAPPLVASLAALGFAVACSSGATEQGAAPVSAGGAGASGGVAGVAGVGAGLQGRADSAESGAGASATRAAGGVAGTAAAAGSSSKAAASGGVAPSAGSSSGAVSGEAGLGDAPAVGNGAAGGAGLAAGGGGETAAASGGSGGANSAANGGGPAAGSGKVFSTCRFHFGSIGDVVRGSPATVKELDFFTPGWMGLKDTFDMQHVCDDTKAGATFEGKVPAIVSYVSAFYAKRSNNLKDCNAPGAQQDLCTVGAGIIMKDLSKIVAIYENYAQGFAGCYGTQKPIIFMMEPDFYQYTVNTQMQPWTAAQAGQIMSQFVMAIKKHLPNASFSLDVSPWVAPNNGEDNGKQWYSNFDMSLFTFIHTSGGGTDASTATIRGSNKMTWRGVSEATGKPILADTGYGVNGNSAGPDRAWDTVNNINARIRDGVTSISQYNPDNGWGTTISQLRAQLEAPSVCP
jgi:hypothetical protein